MPGSAGQGGGRRHTDVCQGRQHSPVLPGAFELVWIFVWFAIILWAKGTGLILGVKEKFF